jgi:hypothetical protein
MHSFQMPRDEPAFPSVPGATWPRSFGLGRDFEWTAKSTADLRRARLLDVLADDAGGLVEGVLGVCERGAGAGERLQQAEPRLPLPFGCGAVRGRSPVSSLPHEPWGRGPSSGACLAIYRHGTASGTG